jgi:hypothetical protein
MISDVAGPAAYAKNAPGRLVIDAHWLLTGHQNQYDASNAASQKTCATQGSRTALLISARLISTIYQKKFAMAGT